MLNSVVSLGSALSGTSKHVLLHNGPDKEALYPFRVIVLPGCLRTRPSHEFSLISPNGRCSKTATRFTVIGYSSSVRIFFGISEWTNRCNGTYFCTFDFHLIFLREFAINQQWVVSPGCLLFCLFSKSHNLVSTLIFIMNTERLNG